MESQGKSEYRQPEVVESFDETEIFGDAPATGTHAAHGSEIYINQA